MWGDKTPLAKPVIYRFHRLGKSPQHALYPQMYLG